MFGLKIYKHLNFAGDYAIIGLMYYVPTTAAGGAVYGFVKGTIDTHEKYRKIEYADKSMKHIDKGVTIVFSAVCGGIAGLFTPLTLPYDIYRKIKEY